MKTTRTYKAFLLLGIFLVSLLHSVVPHYHHAHNTTAETFSHSHDNEHGHGHSHDHDSNEVAHYELEENSFLQKLLGEHAHVHHQHQQEGIVSTTVNVVNKASTSTAKVYSDYFLSFSNVATEINTSKKATYQQLFFIYDSPFLQQQSLRGPPFLG